MTPFFSVQFVIILVTVHSSIHSLSSYSLHRLILFYLPHTSSEGKAYVVCFPGYVLCSGLRMMRIFCLDSTWKTMEEPPRNLSGLSCSPYCAEFCENGGSCVAPGECACLDDFVGQYCQYKRCKGCPEVGGLPLYNVR